MSTRGAALVLALGLSGCAAECGGPFGDAGPIVSDAGPVAVDSGVLTDPLSMPAEPTLDLSHFGTAAECGQCHERQYAEWRTSMHAYAMVDPVYRGLVAVRQRDLGGKQDKFCLQCHTPLGTRAGEIEPGFDFEALSDVAKDGVTCETCHKAIDVARPFNAGLIIDELSPMQGPIADPAPSSYHASEHTTLLNQPMFCASCHDVTEVNGLELERTFAEWSEAPAAGTERTCQSCHMPSYDGTAALDGPFREGLNSHRFVGVDVPLTEGFLTEQEEERSRADVRRLLEGAGSLSLEAVPIVTVGEQLDLYVTVRNNLDAHNLPTGSTFIRQMWVEVSVEDSEGRVLYQTGHLDENGDLRDHYSETDPYGDDDLIVLSSTLIDETGAPVMFTHRATEHISHSLSPLYERTWTLFVPTLEAAPGPLTVRARLRFRTHRPYLLRALGLDALIPRIGLYDLAADALMIEVVE